MADQRHIKQVCPKCGYVTDASSAAGEDGDRSGQVSLCMACAHVRIFADELGTLRECTADELREILAIPDVKRYRATILSPEFQSVMKDRRADRGT